MKIDLTNVAYTKEYQEYRKINQRIFCDDCFEGKGKIELSDKYDIEKSYYIGEFDYVVSGTENCLLDKEGNILYTYRNIDDDAEFCTIIYHRNGNEYMIFRSELYGYSVLNLDTLKDFHYVPSYSFKVKGGETFIWTEVFYNNINNKLAVSGCYWACPYSVILLDFSEPMTPAIWQVDIHDKLDGDYEKYDDIDFIKWDNTDLVLKVMNSETGEYEDIIIHENEYINWIKGDKGGQVMNKPKMILFDYGQTLLDEQPFDGIKGTQAVLENCVYNPNNITAEKVQNLADELNKDIGRYNPETGHLYSLEVHNHQFQKYLYEYFGLELKVSHNELEMVFWNAAAPAIPTKNIHKFLEYIINKNIRFGIISNISYGGEALQNRIHEFFPNVNFEFILATSEYIFRKPHKRIYEIALKKAGLQPEDAWYCGDNAVCDVEGAKASGIMPVWYTGAINQNAVTPKSDCIIINDWLELIKILDAAE